jgi:hypothetical protein
VGFAEQSFKVGDTLNRARPAPTSFRDVINRSLELLAEIRAECERAVVVQLLMTSPKLSVSILSNR